MPKVTPDADRVLPQYEALYRRWSTPLQVLVAVAALATVPVLVAYERGDTRAWVTVTDWAIWSAFLLEFTVMMIWSRDRRRYAAANWVGIAVIVLSFPLLPELLASVRLIRVARLARVFRLARILVATYRGLYAMRSSLGSQSVLYLAAVTAVMTVAGGALLAFLEPDAAPGGFLDGIWWAVVTVTTVGYGDIAPQTFLGRLLAVVLMLCGLGLLSTLAASISAFFVGADGQSDANETQRRLDRIEEKIDRLLAERSGDAGEEPPRSESDRTSAG